MAREPSLAYPKRDTRFSLCQALPQSPRRALYQVAFIDVTLKLIFQSADSKISRRFVRPSKMHENYAKDCNLVLRTGGSSTWGFPNSVIGYGRETRPSLTLKCQPLRKGKRELASSNSRY